MTCSYRTADGRQCQHDVAGADRCLFHSPSTDRAVFKSALTELVSQCTKSKVAIDATGFEFPSDFKWPKSECRVPVVLSVAHFRGTTELDAVVFHEDVDFSAAAVDGSIRIRRCQFRQSLIMPAITRLESLVVEDSRIDVNLLLSTLPFSTDVRVASSTIRGDCMLSRTAPLQLLTPGKLSLLSVTIDDLILGGQQGETLVNSARIRGNISAGGSEHAGKFNVASAAVDGDIELSHAHFNSTVSIRVTAKGTVSLNDASFSELAKLTDSSFYGPVTCLNLDVSAGIDFSGSYFGDRLILTANEVEKGIRFEDVAFCGLVRVSDVKLSSSNRLSFDRSMFSAGCLLEKITAPDGLNGEILLNLSDVFVQPGHAIRLSRPPTDLGKPHPELNINWIDLRGADVQRFDLDFEHAEQLTLSPDGDRGRHQAADIYRGLRHSHQKHLRYAEAGKFFVKEMDLRLEVARGKDRWQHTLLWLYRRTSRYGESYLRPLSLLAILTLITGALGTGALVPAPPCDACADAGRTVASAASWDGYWSTVWSIVSTGIQIVVPLQLPDKVQKDISWPDDPTSLYVLSRVLSISLISFIVIALRRQFQRRPGEDG